jgi:hypothetical protein
LSSRRKSVAIYALVLVLFTLLTLFYTRPLASKASDHTMRENTGDTLFNVYVLSWNAHALRTNPLDLFNASIFYPNRYTLAYSDNEFMSSLIALPVLAITGNGVLGFNFVIIMSFILSAFGAYLLVWHLAHDRYGAFAAGLVFGFSTWRLAHISHMQLLSAEFLPLALLCLHLFTERKKPLWAFLFAVSSIAVFWTVWSYGFYLALAVLIFLVVLAVMQRERLIAVVRRRAPLDERRAVYRWAGLLVASFVLTGLVLLPFTVPYLKAAKLNPNFQRDISEVSLYSADVSDFLVAPPQSLTWGRATSPLRPDPYKRGNESERSLFPGLAAVLLSLAGLVYLAGRGRDRRERFALVFYLALLVVGAVMCLGVTLYFFGHGVNLPMPYKFLYKFFPGFKAIRTPSRIFVLCLLSMAVLSGFGVKWIHVKLDRRLGKVAVAAVMVTLLALMVVDVLPTGIKMRPVQTKDEFPAVFRWMAKRPGDSPTVVLPLTPYDPRSPSGMNDLVFAAMEPQRDYYNTANWKKMLNGYSGYVPVTYREAVKAESDFPSPGAIDFLRREGVRYVILEGRRYDRARLEQILQQIEGTGGMVLVYRSGLDYVYRLK